MIDMLGIFPFLRFRPRIHFTLFAAGCVALVFVIYRLSNDPALVDHDSMVSMQT
jgi:hypothetical protein